VTSVYLETMRRIELEDKARRQVRALCYVVDRSHVQYAGRLTLAESVHHVRQGHGQSGPNRDYVLETVQRWKRWAIARPSCICSPSN
jgi:glutathione-specific gamma-glutamylcyclotransferase